MVDNRELVEDLALTLLEREALDREDLERVVRGRAQRTDPTAPLEGLGVAAVEGLERGPESGSGVSEPKPGADAV